MGLGRVLISENNKCLSFFQKCCDSVIIVQLMKKRGDYFLYLAFVLGGAGLYLLLLKESAIFTQYPVIFIIVGGLGIIGLGWLTIHYLRRHIQTFVRKRHNDFSQPSDQDDAMSDLNSINETSLDSSSSNEEDEQVQEVSAPSTPLMDILQSLNSELSEIRKRLLRLESENRVLRFGVNESKDGYGLRALLAKKISSHTSYSDDDLEIHPSSEDLVPLSAAIGKLSPRGDQVSHLDDQGTHNVDHPRVPSQEEITSIFALSLKEATEEFKRRYVAFHLAACPDNPSETARRLGVQRTYLYQLTRQLGLRDNKPTSSGEGFLNEIEPEERESATPTSEGPVKE